MTPRTTSGEFPATDSEAAATRRIADWTVVGVVFGALVVFGGIIGTYSANAADIVTLKAGLAQHLAETKVAKDKRDDVQNAHALHLQHLDDQFAQILDNQKKTDTKLDAISIQLQQLQEQPHH